MRAGGVGRHRPSPQATLCLTDQGWRIARRRLSAAGSDGWDGAPFALLERLPNPVDPPSPTVLRR